LPLHVAAWIMSLIPVIYLSTNSVRFLPFTWILLLVKYRLVVFAGCSCSCTRIRSMRGTSSSITNTYTLNIDKALRKQLDATKHHQSVLYECIRGGLVITADAATFELFNPLVAMAISRCQVFVWWCFRDSVYKIKEMI
jgi:hypothetical protein